MDVPPDIPLVCRPGLDVSIVSSTEVVLSTPAGPIRSGRRAFDILAAFAQPASINEALAQLGARVRGPRAWMELTSEIVSFASLQILVPESGTPTRSVADEGRFESAPVHIRMLNDRARTTAYQHALLETVGPDDVVLDIGTGSGVLAISAAKAGARRVYAVEATAMARRARELVEQNGLADRVTVIEGRSTDVTLPERATVLVSELIGNDPLAEGVLQTHTDAAQRLLTEDATVIPSNLRLLAVPVTVPASMLNANRFGHHHVERWKEWYGIDFGALASAESDIRIFVPSQSARAWPCLADPIAVHSADLATDAHGPVATKRRFNTRAEGVIGGVLLAFELVLTPEISITTTPDGVSDSNSWASLLWCPHEPVACRAGDLFELRYRYDTRRGSSFELEKTQA